MNHPRVFADAATPARGPAAPAHSLKRLALVGSAWTLGGYAAAQVIRLASSLILTRLLAPDAFGLMALVAVILQGLQMFSDIGIAQSIIQNERGHDRLFLDTAWTIHAIRGVALSLCAAALAWPLAKCFDERLLPIIPVVGITALLSGVSSTALFTQNRDLALKRLTLLEIGSQILATTLSVFIAWKIERSVWAMVWGTVASSALRTVFSYIALPGPHNRPRWDPEAAKAIMKFGRWIFISSVLGFIVARGDRPILGLFGMATLGVYSIAVMVSGFMLDVLQAVSDKVLFPVYVRLKDRPREELRRKTIQVRMAIMLTILPAAIVCVVLGPQIIGLMYKPAFHEAGWMLQILAAGAIFSIVPHTGPAYLAFGDSKMFMFMVASRSVLLLASMLAGGWLGGQVGLVIGVAATNALHYPFNAWALNRYGLWIGRMDAIGFAVSGALVGIGLWIMSMIG